MWQDLNMILHKNGYIVVCGQIKFQKNWNQQIQKTVKKHHNDTLLFFKLCVELKMNIFLYVFSVGLLNNGGI